jgi:hypothetical protein
MNELCTDVNSVIKAIDSNERARINMSFFAIYKELDAIGVKNNTNKASSWMRADGSRESMGEGLLVKYELFLNKLRGKSGLSILELGAGPDCNIGASVRVWKEYFQGASVHVADIKESARNLEREGFHVHVGDLGNMDFVQGLAKQKWDFVIDDASHLWSHQILAFRTLFPSVVSGGIFIMEDLCTSYAHFRKEYSCGFDMKDAVSYFLAISRGTCYPNAVGSDEELRRIYDISNADELLIPKVSLISWIGNSCIIAKR